jgi:hypothetical protein
MKAAALPAPIRLGIEMDRVNVLVAGTGTAILRMFVSSKVMHHAFDIRELTIVVCIAEDRELEAGPKSSTPLGRADALVSTTGGEWV